MVGATGAGGPRRTARRGPVVRVVALGWAAC